MRSSATGTPSEIAAGLTHRVPPPPRYGDRTRSDRRCRHQKRAAGDDLPEAVIDEKCAACVTARVARRGGTSASRARPALHTEQPMSRKTAADSGARAVRQQTRHPVSGASARPNKTAPLALGSGE